MTQARRVIVWLLLAGLLAYLSYRVFFAYLSPELLIDFANTFAC